MFLKLFTFFTLLNSELDNRPIFRITENQSLFMPAVRDNGRNRYWSMFGEHFINAEHNESGSYIKLGWNATNSIGCISSKNPFIDSDIRLDIHTQILLSKQNEEGTGLFVYISKDKVVEPEIFNNNGTLNGTLIGIITNKTEHLKYKSPYIGVTYGDAIQYNAGDLDNVFSYVYELKGVSDIKNYFRIKLSSGKLSVYFDDKVSKLAPLIEIPYYNSFEGQYLHILGVNGNGVSSYKLYGVRTSNIQYRSTVSQNVVDKKENNMGKVIIWVAFIGTFVVLIVTLIPKQVRRK